jgi:hypothetical protein
MLVVVKMVFGGHDGSPGMMRPCTVVHGPQPSTITWQTGGSERRSNLSASLSTSFSD